MLRFKIIVFVITNEKRMRSTFYGVLVDTLELLIFMDGPLTEIVLLQLAIISKTFFFNMAPSAQSKVRTEEPN